LKMATIYGAIPDGLSSEQEEAFIEASMRLANGDFTVEDINTIESILRNK